MKSAREKTNMPNMDKQSAVASHLSVESMKMIADTVGLSNLPDDAARILADDVTHKLKTILQDAENFVSHSKRKRMMTDDIDSALKTKNVEPIYGFDNNDFVPFRFASGGGRELYFNEDKDVDLGEVITSPNLPKLPQDVSIKAHWLSIEGVQPAIPDNPPPVSKEQQRKESIDPASTLKTVPENGDGTQPNQSKNQKSENAKRKKHIETVKVKQLATHELSVEQQLYYKEITEACVGSDEGRRSEALQSLTYDSGLHQMLPRLTTFVSEGVKVNVVQNNLALLIYLMRMVKALLDNSNLYLEKYLHELIPTVITCIVSKQLCMRPDVDNHWALRDFASRLLAQICKNFNTSTNSVQTRITRLLSRAMDNDKLHLSSLYGAISALCELGPEVQRIFVFKRVKSTGDRVKIQLDGIGTTVEKAAAEHIKNLLLRVLPPTIKASRPPPDVLDDYRNEFGYLGPNIHSAVLRSRSASTPVVNQLVSGQVVPTTGASFITGNSGPRQIGILQNRIQITTNSNSQQARRVTPSIISTSPSTVSTSNSQKYVVVQPGPRHLNPGSFIKVIPGGSPATTTPQRIVVIPSQQQKNDDVIIIENQK